jgi:CysZ protein
MPILTAFVRALRDLMHPRVLAVLFLPMVGAIALWSVLGFVFWDTWSASVRALIDGTSAGRWLIAHGASWVGASAAAVGVIALILPAMLVTALVVTEVVAMPVIVSVVSRRYPALAARGGGTTIGSVFNAIAAFSIFAVLWLVSLPLWLTGIGAIVLPALISAYLNQRLFRYEALAEHASRDEYRILVRRSRGQLFQMGLVLALLYYVPFVNLIAPIVAGLAFTHLCLGELERLRNPGPAVIDSTAIRLP